MDKKIFIENVNSNTLNNESYRNVVFTSKNMQFVYMSIDPLDTIKMEIHENTDQFIRIEHGIGIAIINDIKYDLYDDIGLIIPAGSQHMIINTSNIDKLKLYTIYTPPEHKPNTLEIKNPDSIKNDEYYKNKVFHTTFKSDLKKSLEKLKQDLAFAALNVVDKVVAQTDDLGKIEHFVNECTKDDLIVYAESLASPQTILAYPAWMSHRALPDNDRKKLGITIGILFNNPFIIVFDNFTWQTSNIRC